MLTNGICSNSSINETNSKTSTKTQTITSKNSSNHNHTSNHDNSNYRNILHLHSDSDPHHFLHPKAISTTKPTNGILHESHEATGSGSTAGDGRREVEDGKGDHGWGSKVPGDAQAEAADADVIVSEVRMQETHTSSVSVGDDQHSASVNEREAKSNGMTKKQDDIGVRQTKGAEDGDFELPFANSQLVSVRQSDPVRGRGVFARVGLKRGTTVEISPVVPISGEDWDGNAENDGSRGRLEQTVLNDYVFSWKRGRAGATMAMALGIGSLFNHSSHPNVTFTLQPESSTIRYNLCRDVEADEELCIFYGHGVEFSSSNGANGEIFDGASQEEPGDKMLAKEDLCSIETKWEEVFGLELEDLAADSSRQSEERLAKIAKVAQDRENLSVGIEQMGLSLKQRLDAADATNSHRNRNEKHRRASTTSRVTHSSTTDVEVSSTASMETATTTMVAQDSSSTTVSSGVAPDDMEYSEEEEMPRDLIMFKDLPFKKITKIPDLDSLPLETSDFWVVDVPPHFAPELFKLVRSHSLCSNEWRHLKRVKRLDDAYISVLLAHPSRLSEEELLDLFKASPTLAPYTPHLVQVPVTSARNKQQMVQWAKVWPVSYLPIRFGPRAETVKKGWVEGKLEWARRECEKVKEEAKLAKQKGELPIACHVTEPWDDHLHSWPDNPPRSLATAFDTRLSTGNILCHCFSNVIDAVAALDRKGVRGLPRTASQCATPVGTSVSDRILESQNQNQDGPTPLSVASLEKMAGNADSGLPSSSSMSESGSSSSNSNHAIPYLLTSLSLFASHEPCLYCSMALLHSRIGSLYFINKSPGSGGCGSVLDVHEDGGLNHKFEVWEWIGEGGCESHEGQRDWDA